MQLTPDDVRAALDGGEMFVAYLPIATLDDGWCVGAEALPCWRRGDRVVSEREFMPVIEETALAGRVTYWVVETVAAQLDEWLDENADAHVAIHVPPAIIGRGGLEYAAVRAGLRAHFSQIVVEISETGVPDRQALDTLAVAAERGVRVALDGAMLNGTNLALLARCNLSMIKLHPALVGEIAPERPRPFWLTALQPLLRTSLLDVVAAGVDTRYQAEVLRDAGVQMAQGDWVSGPLDAGALRERYARDRLEKPRRA